MGCYKVFEMCVRMAGWCAALVVCCGLSVCGGCKKKAPPLPEVYTNRADDTVYMGQLTERINQQMEVNRARMQTIQQMTQLMLRVKAELPKDADGGQLQAALAADPKWQELEAKEKAQVVLDKKILEEGRDFIRARMLAQDQDGQDVKAGKAKAIDKPLGLAPDREKKDPGVIRKGPGMTAPLPANPSEGGTVRKKKE